MDDNFTKILSAQTEYVYLRALVILFTFRTVMCNQGCLYDGLLTRFMNCAAPVYQMTEYYREGTFSNCRDKWSDLFDCISLKTKPAAQIQVSRRVSKYVNVEESYPYSIKSIRRYTGLHNENTFGGALRMKPSGVC